MDTIQVGNKRTVTTKAVDDAGIERMTDAEPYTWSASPMGVVALAPSADGRVCDVFGVAAGVAQVMANGDADPRPNMWSMIGGTTDFTVSEPPPPSPDMATHLEMAVGDEVVSSPTKSK